MRILAFDEQILTDTGIDDLAIEKADREIVADLRFKVDGGTGVGISVPAECSFTAEDVSIKGDKYLEKFSENQTILFDGTDWYIVPVPNSLLYPSENLFPGKLIIMLDDIGISLDTGVTPVSGDSFTCIVAEEGGLVEKVEVQAGDIELITGRLEVAEHDIDLQEEELKKRNQYVIIDGSVPSVTLHAEKGDNRNDVVVSEDRISFQENGNEAAYVKDDSLMNKTAFITNYCPRVKNGNTWVGELAFIARVNGHFSLKRVNGGIQ